MDLKHCHCETAESRRSNLAQCHDCHTIGFFLVCSNVGKGSQHLIFEVDMSNVETPIIVEEIKKRYGRDRIIVKI